MESKIKINVDVILFIIFLMLKLDGIIDWKWFWVFSPFWIVWIIQICIFIVATTAKAIEKFEYEYCTPRSSVSGSPLVWDAKTNTMYGPHSREE